MATAVKLSSELVESAREASATWSRSMTQQIEHWARIGRALERSGRVQMDRVRAALEADLPYDELAADERAVALDQLEKDVFQPQGAGDLAVRLQQRGVPLSGIDENGELAEFRPDGEVVPRRTSSRQRKAPSPAKAKNQRPRRRTKAR